MGARKLSILGMLVEVRDYVPNDTILIVGKGKANWVKKTDGSEVLAIIKKPQIETIIVKPKSTEKTNG